MLSDRRDGGHSIVELNIAVLVLAVILASVFTLVIGLSRDTGNVGGRVELNSDVSPALEQLVTDLRQSTPSHTSGTLSESPVRYLDDDQLAFTVDVSAVVDGPELVEYAIASCLGGLCELTITVTSPNPLTSTPSAYDYVGGTVIRDTVLVERISQPTVGDPFFEGADFDTGTRVATASCDAVAGTACDFDIVEVSFQAAPVNGEPRRFNELVRLRNVA